LREPRLVFVVAWPENGRVFSEQVWGRLTGSTIATVDRRSRAPAALVIAALFLSRVADGLYGGTGAVVPATVTLLTGAGVWVSVLAWFAAYSRRERISWPLDMGLFLWLAWAVIVPYYVLKREGKSGLARLGLFCLAYVAAWATGLAIRVWLRVLS
jgi:hypothetical protein